MPPPLPDLSPDLASPESTSLPPLDPLYRFSQAAELLGMTQRSLYQIARRGEFKGAYPTKGRHAFRTANSSG